MYVWIWHHLPGNVYLRAAQALFLIALVSRAAAVLRVPVDRAEALVHPRHRRQLMTRILVVDNYDSFVYNLVQYLAQLGAEVEVRRNDAVAVVGTRLVRRRRRADLTRPGHAAGRRRQHGDGVGLRLAARCRCSACASATRRSARCSAPTSCGRPSCCTARPARSTHDGTGVLAGLPSPFTATRYHSLAVDEATLPPESW